ncbi:hypothetical protein CFC21_077931 [Triticum aestivum]|uniref:Cyclin-dependent kinase inhibitor domain-containing protein n=3 Tax=Triticinae TaxID=1648030 RepID=A0A3B6MST2_WHEAT|nr:hypothetical protein CFC21_077931 [Triticum aestivum]
MAATAAATVTATAAASSCSKGESVGIAAPADLSVSSSPSPCLPSFLLSSRQTIRSRAAAYGVLLLTPWLLFVVVRRTKKAKKGRSPPAEEMEAFFAAAEGDVARRFAAKYNYDVVTDAPMDGRYEWVRVRP